MVITEWLRGVSLGHQQGRRDFSEGGDMITRNWKLIGIGLLITGFVRGCPQPIQQSKSPTEKQPLQSLETNKTPDSSDGSPSSLFRIPKTPFVFTRSSESSQLDSIVRNQAVLNAKTQSKSPQLSTILVEEKRKTSLKNDQITSRNFGISRFQTTESDNSNFTDQDPAPPAEVENSQGSRIEITPKLVPGGQLEPSDPLAESPPNPAERNTFSSTESSLASQNPQFPNPVVSTNPQSTSGNCDYPWEINSAGNRCGDRAASERPNLMSGSTSNSYSPPLSNRYSVPISSFGSTYVKPHMRNGHYVRGHYRRKR